MNEIVRLNQVEDKIITIRNTPVIIDSDVAAIYGVETRDINKAVKNNPGKFPEGYILELKKNEKEQVVESFHHLENIKYSPALPKAFTEKGLYMLATILKSPKAAQTTIEIVETFAKIRELSRTVSQLSDTNMEKKKQKSLMQRSGEILSDVLGDDLQTTGTETTIEINLAVLKLKHTIKQKTR